MKAIVNNPCGKRIKKIKKNETEFYHGKKMSAYNKDFNSIIKWLVTLKNEIIDKKKVTAILDHTDLIIIEKIIKYF